MKVMVQEDQAREPWSLYEGYIQASRALKLLPKVHEPYYTNPRNDLS